MKYVSIVLLALGVLTSCKSNDEKKIAQNQTIQPLTIAEKIANAHGYENWKDVSEVKFTFKVDRDTIKGNGRSWRWFPKKDSVVMHAGEQVVKFNRMKLDGVPPNADRNFVNDKFWVFVPFQLVWDTSANISEPRISKSPIHNEQLNVITITYSSEGGYTPGDAYDIFYDDNYMIKEWNYRRGNSEEPSLSTTFENYKDYNGIKIATDHKQKGGNWNLNFADVSVTLE